MDSGAIVELLGEMVGLGPIVELLGEMVGLGAIVELFDVLLRVILSVELIVTSLVSVVFPALLKSTAEMTIAFSFNRFVREHTEAI